MSISHCRVKAIGGDVDVLLVTLRREKKIIQEVFVYERRGEFTFRILY